MKNGICNIAFIPIRKEPADSSEMVSQILFGETFEILQTDEKWSLIANHFDSYRGWISNNSIIYIEKDELIKIQSSDYLITEKQTFYAKNISSRKNLLLPAGCILRELRQNSFSILNDRYIWDESPIYNNTPIPEKKIKDTAYGMLNTPYLWGGRSSFGIDCSGFVQTCYRTANINLRRDAYQQVEQGEPVEFVNHRPLDIAFFSNSNSRIVHTGICLENNKIIHASGKVKIDILDKNGIFNTESQSYSHTLSCIRRVMI